MKPFPIIYADPAWSYKDKANAGKRGASHKYTVTSTADICALPVPQIAAKDCTLFMWATCPMLPDALRVMQAWGFEFRTVAFVWVKMNTKAWTPFFGMGNWTRANAEIVLLGVKGKPKRVCAAVPQLVIRRRLRHSEKPVAVRNAIVRLMGDERRVELFARERASGWHSWGNEVESTINL